MLFGQITRLAEARLKQTGRRIGLRVTLAALAALALLVFVFFGLAAVVVWMAHSMRLETALAIVAGGGLVVVLAVMIALSIESRRYQRLAAKRQSFDQQLVRTAALAAMPSRMPSRSVTGLGLVAVGALLVLLGRRRDE